MFNRSRRNLARWFTLSVGSILIVFAGGIYYQVAVEQLEVTDRYLYKKVRVMAANMQFILYQQQENLNLDNVPYLGNNPSPPDSEIVYARWYNAEGKLRQFFGAPPPERLSNKSEFQTIKTTNNSVSSLWLRQITIPVLHKNQVIGYLQIAVPMTHAQTYLSKFLLLLVLTMLVALGVTSLTGWCLGGLAMQPIRYSYEQLQLFTANASHELRAPLAALLSNAQVGLLASVDDGHSKHLRLAKIAEVAKSMNTLVRNLLLLARQGGCLNPDSLKEIDLNDLLRQLIDSQTIQAAAHHLRLQSDLPQQPILVQADPELLSQAVTNLLTNACKYTPAGGIVKLRLLTENYRAVIQVEDNGVGISAADLPHIFDRFYRVDKQRARETGGFGLGLAIAQQIVQAHSGHLSVKSEVGQGSIFQIELPMSASLKTRPSVPPH